MDSICFARSLSELERAVKELGNTVRMAGVLWSDEKYEELASSISDIARRVKESLDAGHEAEMKIQAFEAIVDSAE